MCSILKKFLLEAKKNNSSAPVSAFVYTREIEGQYIKRKELRSFSLVGDLSCEEVGERLDLKFNAWERGRVVDFNVSLPLVKTPDGLRLPYTHSSKEEFGTTNDGYFVSCWKFRKNHLALYTRDKKRAQDDTHFSDFGLEFQEPFWSLDKEVEKELLEGKKTKWQ